MTRTIILYSPKGGQGCTTVAAALALELNRAGIAVNLFGAEDMPTILGLPNNTRGGAPEPVDTGSTLLLTAWSGHVGLSDALATYGDTAINIVDCGTNEAELRKCRERPDTLTFMVITGCYLALRRASMMATRPDRIVFRTEPGRALGVKEAEHVTGTAAITGIPDDPAVRRAIDAGLLINRVPRSLSMAVRVIATVYAAPAAA